MNRPWVAIQRNPTSGSGKNRSMLFDLIARLKHHSLVPRLFARREKLARAIQEPEARQHLVCIVAAGGDGTLGDVINRYPDVPVAVLPLGTENLFARYLGIPKSGTAVADIIAQNNIKRFDLGLLGDRRFSLMASVGFDADVAHRNAERRTGNITKWNYLQPILMSLRKYQYPELRFYLDDATEPLLARLGFIMNLPPYALKLPIANSARADDGIMDLRLFQRGSTFQMIRYCYKVARGVHEKLPDVTSVRASRIRVEADVPVPVQVDGDPAGWTPLEVTVLPAALEVFTPLDTTT